METEKEKHIVYKVVRENETTKSWVSTFALNRLMLHYRLNETVKAYPKTLGIFCFTHPYYAILSTPSNWSDKHKILVCETSHTPTILTGCIAFQHLDNIEFVQRMYVKHKDVFFSNDVESYDNYLISATPEGSVVVPSLKPIRVLEQHEVVYPENRDYS